MTIPDARRDEWRRLAQDDSLSVFNTVARATAFPDVMAALDELEHSIREAIAQEILSKLNVVKEPRAYHDGWHRAKHAAVNAALGAPDDVLPDLSLRHREHEHQWRTFRPYGKPAYQSCAGCGNTIPAPKSAER